MSDRTAFNAGNEMPRKLLKGLEELKSGPPISFQVTTLQV